MLGNDFEVIISDIAAFYDQLRSDSQLRWLGPEKGVIHMAVGGIINAVWDMWPVPKASRSGGCCPRCHPEAFVRCLDFRYVSDAITRDEALAILRRNAPTRPERIERLQRTGFPAYTTSPGWLGYGDEKLRRLCGRRHSAGI